jgi:exodeoxyribonuclease VII small subunit
MVMEEKKSFETALRSLEEIVERLERGDLSLEESLSFFEQGVMCATHCQKRLQEVEAQVEVLLKKQDGSFAVGEFEK